MVFQGDHTNVYEFSTITQAGQANFTVSSQLHQAISRCRIHGRHDMHDCSTDKQYITSRVASAHLEGLDHAKLVVVPAVLEDLSTTWQRMPDSHHREHKDRWHQQHLLEFVMTVHLVGHTAAAAAVAAA